MQEKDMQNYSALEVLSNKKVLCLEDEPGILKNLVETLELFFGEVDGVSDGLEAKEQIDSNAYDALVLDICVPRIDGLEIVKNLRHKDRKIPVIILSSHAEQEYLWRAVELNITRYLQKPYDKDAFIDALKDVALSLSDYHQIINLGVNSRYDFAKKIVFVGSDEHRLSKSESKLFEYFLNNKNKTITYEQLFDYMWDFDQPSKEAIKTIVKELRKKIGKDIIKNLYAVGYRCDI